MYLNIQFDLFFLKLSVEFLDVNFEEGLFFIDVYIKFIDKYMYFINNLVILKL